MCVFTPASYIDLTVIQTLTMHWWFYIWLLVGYLLFFLFLQILKMQKVSLHEQCNNKFTVVNADVILLHAVKTVKHFVVLAAKLMSFNKTTEQKVFAIWNYVQTASVEIMSAAVKNEQLVSESSVYHIFLLNVKVPARYGFKTLCKQKHNLASQWGESQTYSTALELRTGSFENVRF